MPPQEDILILKGAILWWTLVPAIFMASEAFSLLLIFWKEIPKEGDKAWRGRREKKYKRGPFAPSVMSKCKQDGDQGLCLFLN